MRRNLVHTNKYGHFQERAIVPDRIIACSQTFQTNSRCKLLDMHQTCVQICPINFSNILIDWYAVDTTDTRVHCLDACGAHGMFFLLDS